MNGMTKGSVALALLALMGCATGLPTRSGPDRGGIGISVQVRPPNGLVIFTRASQRVYFVRLDGEKGPFTQDQFILSNYSAEGWVYLLDAPPGRYAAVASVFSRLRKEYVTIFSKQLIEATAVTVSPGAMAFMGEHFLRASSGFDDADSAQRHYLKVIWPSAFTATAPTAVTFYVGSAFETKRDQETEIRFLNTATGHFQGTEWNGLLDRLTGGLKGR